MLARSVLRVLTACNELLHADEKIQRMLHELLRTSSLPLIVEIQKFD